MIKKLSLEKKLKSYAHHREYDLNSLGIQKIKNKIQNKESIYDLNVDMRKSKFEGGQKLSVLETNELPIYIQNNKYIIAKYIRHTSF